MLLSIKSESEILNKLGIEQLNPMQIEAKNAILNHAHTVLLSPTGTGKTLAFLLPILQLLQKDLDQVQALILVPSRELAIQIEQVVRQMGSGYKANAVYGGRSILKDKNELSHPPAILIGTPGRVADHLRRNSFSTQSIKYLVLDEFDKSLEVGFEEQMREILAELGELDKKVLTSATQKAQIPAFVNLEQSKVLNYLQAIAVGLSLKSVACSKATKLDTLLRILSNEEEGRGIIFCNFKDSIAHVSSFLEQNKVEHVCFYGGLDQADREHALIKFRNGSSRFLLATDLAARGIDVPEIDFVIHFELPSKKEEFTHRNGRTARMNANGIAYVLNAKDDRYPDFIKDAQAIELKANQGINFSNWQTLYLTGGRKDKISKGDIVGLFIKEGGLKSDEISTIELKQECAYLAVPKSKADMLCKKLNNTKLKTKKVRINKLK